MSKSQESQHLWWSSTERELRSRAQPTSGSSRRETCTVCWSPRLSQRILGHIQWLQQTAADGPPPQLNCWFRVRPSTNLSEASCCAGGQTVIHVVEGEWKEKWVQLCQKRKKLPVFSCVFVFISKLNVIWKLWDLVLGSLPNLKLCVFRWRTRSSKENQDSDFNFCNLTDPSDPSGKGTKHSAVKYQNLNLN